jgi:hypothetical protein
MARPRVHKIPQALTLSRVARQRELGESWDSIGRKFAVPGWAVRYWYRMQTDAEYAARRKATWKASQERRIARAKAGCVFQPIPKHAELRWKLKARGFGALTPYESELLAFYNHRQRAANLAHYQYRKMVDNGVDEDTAARERFRRYAELMGGPGPHFAPRPSQQEAAE